MAQQRDDGAFQASAGGTNHQAGFSGAVLAAVSGSEK
jgi:hypothetical protein